MITSPEQLNPVQTYTYADYLTWKFDEFVELIRGKVYKMSPAPKSVHQAVSWRLGGELYYQLKGRSCKAFSAPFDVRLVKNATAGVSDSEIYSVVQPDLCVICDISKIDERGCKGAPDFIIEILSESTLKRDVQDKFSLYEENGVREYWIASPEFQTIERFFSENGKFVFKGYFTKEDKISSLALPNIEIDLSEVFEA